jgi:hypothetical protein
MNITITHTIDPSIINLLQAFVGNLGGQAPSKSNGNAKAITAPPAKEKEVAPAAETSTQTAGGKVSLPEIRALIQSKSGEGKREQVKALLADFSVPNASVLKPDQFTDFHAKLSEL